MNEKHLSGAASVPNASAARGILSRSLAFLKARGQTSPRREQIVRKNLQTAATCLRSLLRTGEEIRANEHVPQEICKDFVADLRTLGRNLQMVSENLHVDVGNLHEFGPKRRVSRKVRIIPHQSESPPKYHMD
jgi:hypothetical protein